MSESYPRLSARTRRFSLGAPRNFKAGGGRTVFLRSPAGDDPRTALWVLEDGEERLVAAAEPAELTDEERARRERMRETAEGITSFAIDRDAMVAAFAVGGRLYRTELATGESAELEAPGPVHDPKPDPAGRRIAFVCDGALHVHEDGEARELAAEDGITYGLPDFIAAEEMGRHYGYVWAPDGEALLATRVDESPVRTWWIADAVDPDQEPRSVRYPAACTDNADVSLHVVRLDGATTRIEYEAEYLASFGWDDHGPFAVVQPRDQKTLTTLTIDPATGATAEVVVQHDDAWVELVPGVPARLDDGRWVTVDHERLKVDGEEIAPDLHVRAVAKTDAGITFTASSDPAEVHVYRWEAGALTQLTHEPGVHATAGGVIASRTLDRHGASFAPPVQSFAAAPDLEPQPRFLETGVALVVPRDHDGGPLPLLLDPYGGPHHQKVLRARGAFYEAQWFADQGFAVLVVDGAGTPGRGRDFTTAIEGDFSRTLEDQVNAIDRLDLETTGVAIRGWSFGGYLAALAVLRRPDVFDAAIAGAPVIDWRLYDTHYTERYLQRDPAAYERSSLIDEAHTLTKPLLLIHGLVDDNVVAAHSLRFSRALTEAGRPHTFLPLTGVTHMAAQEEVAENLLLLQVDFLRRALGVRPDPARSGT
jgi:dipeptidyl-peptidase-4